MAAPHSPLRLLPPRLLQNGDSAITVEFSRNIDEAANRWGEFLTVVEDDTRGDETFAQRITQAAQDYESIGWAVLEVSRPAQVVTSSSPPS